MICYKDKTFCRATDCKKFDKCVDALTDEVVLRASAAGMLLSQQDKFGCYEPFEDEVLHNYSTAYSETQY